jgi:hypothetical protein
VTKPVYRKNILDLVDGLEAPAVVAAGDLKELYFKEQAAKYGF